MTPKTPLPWTELPCYFDNQCQAFEPQDAEFMLEACNQFPRAMALIEKLNQLVAMQESEITRLRRHVHIGPGIE